MNNGINQGFGEDYKKRDVTNQRPTKSLDDLKGLEREVWIKERPGKEGFSVQHVLHICYWRVPEVPVEIQGHEMGESKTITRKLTRVPFDNFAFPLTDEQFRSILYASPESQNGVVEDLATWFVEEKYSERS